MTAPLTRGDAITAGLGALAAAVGLPALARGATTGAPNTDPATPNDREALGFVFVAEAVQIALYRAAATAPVGPAVRRFAREALAQERRHVATLRTINRLHRIQPNRPSRFNFRFATEGGYLRTLLRVEDAVVAGYGGVAVAIEVPSLYLVDLVPILAEEMAQAAVIRTFLGDPTPDAFTDPKPFKAVQPVLDAPQVA